MKQLTKSFYEKDCLVDQRKTVCWPGTPGSAVWLLLLPHLRLCKMEIDDFFTHFFKTITVLYIL